MEFEVHRRPAAAAELGRRNAGLEILAEGARQLLTEQAPEATIRRLCEAVMAHLDCQAFANFVAEPGQPGLRLAAHAGLPEAALQAIGCAVPGAAPQDCLHRPGCQRAGICGSAAAEAGAAPLAAFGIRAYACQPLLDQGRNIGILAFGTGTRPRFSDDDLDLMRAVADLVAAALARARDKAALQASEERLQLALAGAEAGCYEWHLGTGESVWSEEIWALYGLEPHSAPAAYETWRRTVHPDDLARAEETIAAAVARGVAFEAEWQVRVPPGSPPRWLLSRARPIPGEDGRPVRYVGIAIDITRRKRTEAALRENQGRLRLALEGANAGIWDWHFPTGELAWSPAQGELGSRGAGAPAPTAADWEKAVHPEDLPGVKARLAALVDGRENRYRDEWRVVHPQRGTRWILALGNIVRAGDRTPLRMYGINIDITERKEWEQELARRVAERTAELTAANRELEAFTYAASHDLKAPLGRINSFCTLLDRGYRERLAGDGLVFLDFIQQNARRLNRLVEDLLAHAHIGQQPPALLPVDVGAAARAVLRERAEEIRQRGADIRLGLPAGMAVQGNAPWLSQILRSLVDNALKYSDPAGPAVIEIGGQRQGNRCRLWVRDNGIGLDMAYKDRIFEIFRRLHTYEEYPGSGIGLALVKKAVEHMDGRVWVESAPGQGAAFFLDLPAA